MEAGRIEWNRRFDSQPFSLGAAASPFLRREMERVFGTCVVQRGVPGGGMPTARQLRRKGFAAL